jgi:hypothetical protein
MFTLAEGELSGIDNAGERKYIPVDIKAGFVYLFRVRFFHKKYCSCLVSSHVRYDGENSKFLIDYYEHKVLRVGGEVIFYLLGKSCGYEKCGIIVSSKASKYVPSVVGFEIEYLAWDLRKEFSVKKLMEIKALQ